MEITLPEGRIATYEVIGSGAEALLTFVGGPGLSARLMRADAELFAERFTCYFIDPHGSSSSTPPQDETAYDFVGHARFYEQVRRALGLGPVSVYGVSFGGSVALTYAALFPKVTTRCVAVSAFAVGEDLDEEEGGDAAAEMEAALARHAHAEWYPEAREIWDDWTARALAASDPAEIRDMLAKVFPLYTAYPDRPDVRKAIDEARAMLEVDASGGRRRVANPPRVRSHARAGASAALSRCGSELVCSTPSQTLALDDARAHLFTRLGRR
jgi:pimeloyl-ACP methyl ester carboxylesterase